MMLQRWSLVRVVAHMMVNTVVFDLRRYSNYLQKRMRLCLNQRHLTEYIHPNSPWTWRGRGLWDHLRRLEFALIQYIYIAVDHGRSTAGLSGTFLAEWPIWPGDLTSGRYHLVAKWTRCNIFWCYIMQLMLFLYMQEFPVLIPDSLLRQSCGI